MGAFTSKAAGFFDSAGQTTWNEVGVPGAGDTFSYTHNITVRDARIIGTSPSNQTTIAFQGSNGATLKIDGGGSLTCRGNGFLNGATLQVGDAINGGGIFEFDAHLAGIPATNYYVAVGCANNFNPRSWLVTRGTAGSPSVIRSNAGGGNGFFGSTNAVGNAPTNDRLNACFLDLQRCDFLRIGTAAVRAFYPSINSDAGITYTLDHCTLTACGDWRPEYNLPNDTNLVVTNNRWSGTVGSWGLRYSTGGVVTGARTIAGNSFDKTPVIGIDHATITDNFFAQGWTYLQGVGRALSVARNFVRWIYFDEPIVRAGDWDGNYMLADFSTYNGAGRYTATAAFANPHWTTPVGGDAGRYPVTRCVFDSAGSDGVGDIDYGPNAAGFHSDFTYNLVLPDQISDAGVPRNAGTLATNNGWAGEASTYDHNTFYSGGQGPLALAEAGNGHAGMIDSYRSNVVWNSPGSGALGFNYLAHYPTSPAGAVEDQIVPARCTHNVGFNVRGDGANLGSGNTNGHYNVRGSAPLGANDVYADPQFVDPTRNFSTWVASVQAAWGAGAAFPANGAPSRTDYNAHGLYLLDLHMSGRTADPDYDPRYTLAALVAYVTGGFAPQNPAVKDNGHDGVTRGAVAFADVGGGFVAAWATAPASALAGGGVL